MLRSMAMGDPQNLDGLQSLSKFTMENPTQMISKMDDYWMITRGTPWVPPWIGNLLGSIPGAARQHGSASALARPSSRSPPTPLGRPKRLADGVVSCDSGNPSNEHQ